MGLREDCELDAVIPSDDLGDVFTWNGTDWPGTIGDAGENAVLQIGGDMFDVKFVIVTPKAQFGATLPAQRDAVTVNGEAYRLGPVNTSPSDPFLELTVIHEP